MAHDLQARYSDMVLAKVRKELVLKDGVVFNNDYEGSPKAGLVKIPTRDTEVAVSDYDKANGVSATAGSTSYTNLVIDGDKAVNEIVDGYDAEAVPDGIVADRLDSAGYALASAVDNAGATTLLGGATVVNETTLDKDNIYGKIVDLRTAMSKANIPNDGKRFLLAKPDTMALLLKSPEFISASSLGDSVKDSGIIGRIAGFNVIEWNDNTANLAMLAGHPRFATRANEWSVDVHLQNLDGSGKYIGASAVQGRFVFGHKVLRQAAIRAVYTPAALGITLAQGATTGTTIATVTGGAGSLEYILNPANRAVYNAAYDGTALTSGTTEIAVAEGDIIEIVDVVSNKVAKVGYIVVPATAIK